MSSDKKIFTLGSGLSGATHWRHAITCLTVVALLFYR